MIERVEIIRGPGSALFGTDASAGVINVITKTAGSIEDSQAVSTARVSTCRLAAVGTTSTWR